MISGVCKLCQKSNELRDSHLIAKGILRKTYGPNNESPKLITAKAAVTMARQMTAFVLCSAGEQRLNHRGENWMIPQVATDYAFPLWDLIRTAPRLPGNYGRLELYMGRDVLGAKVDDLVYFGLSVFWRTAAHTWRYLAKDPTHIELGEYEEPMRRFLAGETGMPSDMVMGVRLFPGELSRRRILFPAEWNGEDGFRYFRFMVPCLQFDLRIEPSIPWASQQIDILHNPLRPIVVDHGVPHGLSVLEDKMLDMTRITAGALRSVRFDPSLLG